MEPVIGLRHSPKESQGDYKRDHAAEGEPDIPVERTNVSFQSEVSDMDKATTLLFGDDDQADDYEQHYLSAMELTQDQTDLGEIDQRPASADYTRHRVPKDRTTGAKTQDRLGSKAVETRPSQNAELMLSQLDELADLDQGLSQQSARSERTKLKSKLSEESEQRQMHEETLNQLQIEYNTLLKKYAEAENTIDELRLGAKVTLYGEMAPASGQAQTGTLPAAQHPQAFSLSQRGTASYHSGGVGSVQGSRPGSRASQAGSASLWLPGVSGGSGNQTAAPQSMPTLSREETSSLAEEGAKLSLLAKAKAAEDQILAFQILLDENHLSLEDQDKALQNIKDGMEKLQQDYRDAKEENEFMRRQGLSNGEGLDMEFDENKDVEGELYKLNMKLDDLEHRVQGNLKQKSTRVPYKGPVKADHSIGVPMKATSTPVEDLDRTPQPRPPSVCSLTGSNGEIEDKVQQLNKDYSDLMGRYKQLKERRKTPERDEVINNLLKQLRNIYEDTPEDSRLPLPAELKQQYHPEDSLDNKERQVVGGSPKRELLDSSRYSSRRQTDRESRDRPIRSQRESREIRRRETRKRESPKSTVRDDSDPSSSPERGPRHRPPSPGSTSEYTSGMSAHDLDRRKRQQPRQPIGERSSVETGRRSDSHRRLPHVTPKRRDLREDKDSGYVGSESSRKTGNSYPGVGARRAQGSTGRTGGPGKTNDRKGSSQAGPKRTNALGEPRAEYYSDSDSGSSADTVEEKRYAKMSPSTSKADGRFDRGDLSVAKSQRSDGHYRTHDSPKGSEHKGRSSRGGSAGQRSSAGHRSAGQRDGSTSDEEVRTISEGRHSSNSDKSRKHSNGTMLSQRLYTTPGGVSSQPGQPGHPVVIPQTGQPGHPVVIPQTGQPGHPVVIPQPLQPGLLGTGQTAGQVAGQVAGHPGAQQTQYYYYPTGYQFDTGIPTVYGAHNGHQHNAPQNGQVQPPQQMPHSGFGQAGALDYTQEQTYQASGNLPSRYLQPSDQALRESQREAVQDYQDERGRGEYESRDPRETWGREDYYSQDPYQETPQAEEEYSYGERSRYQTKHRPPHSTTSRYEENEPPYQGDYLSEPDVYKESSRERYSRLRDYYSDKPRSRHSSPSRRYGPRGASKVSQDYTDYENTYPADTDRRQYLSQREGYATSQGSRDPYQRGGGVAGSRDPYQRGGVAGSHNPNQLGGGVAEGYGATTQDTGYGASGLSSHQNTGIQNVPHMQHQGSQYLPPQGAEPYLNGAAGQSGYPYNGTTSQVTFAVPLTQQYTPTQAPSIVNSTYEHPGAASGAYPTPHSHLVGVPGGTPQTVVGLPTALGPQVPQPGMSYTAVPHGNPAHSVYGLPVTPQATYGQIPAAVGSVVSQGTSGAQKVRYYVREYGADDKRNTQETRPKSHRKSTKNYSDSENEGESDDLNSSLTKALETSKQLKKMSRRMKRSLNEELESSYREVVHGY